MNKRQEGQVAVFLAFVFGVGMAVLVLVPFGGPSAGGRDWGDVPSWVEALAVVVGIGYAAGQLSHSRAVRADESRPYVIVSAHFLRGTAWTIRLENIGRSPAWDVQTRFTPPVEGAFDDQMRGNVGHGLGDMAMFRGIGFVPPNYRWETLFDHLGKRKERGLPDRYEVELSYHDGRGNSFNDPPIVLDFAELADIMPPKSDLELLRLAVEAIAKPSPETPPKAR